MIGKCVQCTYEITVRRKEWWEWAEVKAGHLLSYRKSYSDNILQIFERFRDNIS